MVGMPGRKKKSTTASTPPPARGAAKKGAPAAPKERRAAQILEAFRMTRQADPKVAWLLPAIFVGVFLVFLALGFALGHPIYFGVLGVPFAFLITTIAFGRRAQAAAFRQVEGRPGAAAAVLNTMRRGWTITPAVAVTRNQDVVHRAVGRPGVVLVGEGAPGRVTNLVANERRRTARFVLDTPIYEVIAGDGDGEIPLRKLQAHLTRLPRNLRPAEVSELNRRLRALQQTAVPIPKGPLPKNVRMPKGPRS